jgi:hypothetical protein
MIRVIKAAIGTHLRHYRLSHQDYTRPLPGKNSLCFLNRKERGEHEAGFSHFLEPVVWILTLWSRRIIRNCLITLPNYRPIKSEARNLYKQKWV